MRRSRRESRGFTLFEIIVSLALISLVLLSVFRLQSQSLDLLSDAGISTMAGQLIHQRLSLIRCMEVVKEGESNGDFGENFPDIRYKEEIRAVPTLPNLFRVTLHLILGPDPGPRLFRIETLLYKPKTEGSP